MKLFSKYHLHYLLISVILIFLSWGYFERINAPGNTMTVAESIEEELHNRFNAGLEQISQVPLVKKVAQHDLSYKEIKELNNRPEVYGVFRQDSLIWWSNYKVDIPGLARFVQPSEPLMRLENGYYKIYSKAYEIAGIDYYAVVLIPVKYQYSIENQYLKSTFACDQLPGEIGFSITANEDARTNAVVKGQSGEPLFYLWPKTSSESKVFPALSLWLFFFGILFLLLFINTIAKWIGRATSYEWGWLFLVVAIFFLRYVSLFIFYPLFLPESDFFSPHYYASSDWAPSLGDLFINVVIIFWAAWYFYRYVRLISITQRASRHILSVVFSTLIFFASYYILEVTETLVIDSNLSFDINNFLSIPIYSWIGVIILSLLFGSYYLIGIRLLVIINGWMGSWKTQALYYLIGMGTWIIMTFWFALPRDMVISCSVALIFLGFANIDVKEIWKGDRFYKIILWIGLASLVTSFYLDRFNNIKEQENEVLYANLLLQKDYLTEFLFGQVKDEMVRDPFVRNYFKGDYISKRQLEDQLNFVYLKGHLSKYDIKVRTYNARTGGGLSAKLKEYYSLIDSSGRVSEVEGLYFFPDSPEKLEYLAIVRVYENPENQIRDELLGRVVIEFQTKSIGYSTIYPELLLKEAATPPDLYKQYDYAIYVNDRLVKRTGNYSYPVEFNDTLTNRIHKITRHEYEHLLYQDQTGKVVWVSKPKEGKIEPFSLFSIILLLYILVYFLLVGMIQLLENPNELSSRVRMKNISFSTRIQLIVIGIILISFLVIGAVVIVNIVNEYNDYHHDRLIRKSKQILSNLEYLKNEGSDTLMSWEQLLSSDQLKANLSNLSEVHTMDFNLYGSSARLIESSQPGVFERGLISHYLHPLALFEVFQKKSSQYVHQEEIGGLDFLASYIPIMDRENNLIAILNLPYYAKEKNLKEEISNFLVYFINIYVLLLALAGVLGLVISNSITRPISQLGERMRRVQLGARNTPIKWKKKDEIGRLISEYNHMLEQLEESARLLAQTERESAWREMARQVAHEIKNPLTPMRLSLQHLQRSAREIRSGESERIQRVSKTLLEQIDQLNHIATEFSNFAKMPRAENSKLNLTKVVEAVVKLYDNEDIELNLIKPDRAIYVYADDKQLSRVFQNIVKNALESIPSEQKGTVSITSREVVEEGQRWAQVVIKDNGIGISADQQKRIFEPNFTTKTTGTGLGLPISKKIIELTGGTIEVKSEPNVGSTFIVSIPIYAEQTDS